VPAPPPAAVGLSLASLSISACTQALRTHTQDSTLRGASSCT
jgi:hypothetical protein